MPFSWWVGTYRKFSGDGVEAHVDRVLEVGRIGDVRFRVIVGRFGDFDFVFERFLLAVGIVRFCGGGRNDV